MVSRFGTIGGIGRVMSSGFIVSLVSDSTIEAYDKDETSESTEASLMVFGVGVTETCLSVQKLLISDGGTTGDGVAETCAVVWRNSISSGFKKFTAVVSVALVVCADCADCTACALYADCAACAAAL